MQLNSKVLCDILLSLCSVENIGVFIQQVGACVLGSGYFISVGSGKSRGLVTHSIWC
jgi:hypothetical protein